MRSKAHPTVPPRASAQFNPLSVVIFDLLEVTGVPRASTVLRAGPIVTSPSCDTAR